MNILNKLTISRRLTQSDLSVFILILFTFSSCSYLPAEYTDFGIPGYQETTEYIKLTSSEPGTNSTLIFLPGGLVDPHAYISLMNKVAQEGTSVIILKLSANLAILEMSKPLRVMDDFPDVQNWYISGHSLGGISAQSLVNKKPDLFNGLILLGVYPSERYSISDWDKNVLSIYAENDQLSTIEEIEANENYLPVGIKINEPAEIDSLDISNPATLYYLINGGNHSQFGNYGFQKGDGVSAISTEEQHEKTSTLIIKYINWNESL